MIILQYLTLITLMVTLIYASYLDLKDRRVPFKNWKPLIIIGGITTALFIYLNLASFGLMTNVIIITTIIVFWVCGYFKLYGGADAWALIFITLFSITIPFNPILSNIHTGIGVSSYINSYIIYILLFPFHKYMFDKSRGVPYMLFITIGFFIAIIFGDIYNFVVGVVL